MKPNEKKIIFILVIITIIVGIISLFVKNSKKEEKQETIDTGYTQTQEDGTKINTSEKLTQEKQLGTLKVSNISITELEGETTIRASIENTSMSTVKEFPITIKLLNEMGETLQEVGAYVGRMKAGESRQIHASVTMESSTIYDISFSKN